jgi:hypothetical protein
MVEMRSGQQLVGPETVPSVRDGLRSFWRFYLTQHSHPKNRLCHILGSSLALISMIAALLIQPWFWLVAGISGYGFAWYGHFVYEKNKPATFKAPVRSLICDYVMVIDTLRQWICSK